MVAFGGVRGCGTEKQKEEDIIKEQETTFMGNGHVHFLDCGDGFVQGWPKISFVFFCTISVHAPSD